MSYSSSDTSLPGAWLAYTAGDPAGIGPDLMIMLAAAHRLDKIVVISSRDVIEERAVALGVGLEILEWPNRPVRPGQLTLIWCGNIQLPGHLDVLPSGRGDSLNY